MKYKRELKVGALALVCLFLLIFGFNYLKGVNIFSSVFGYQGRFPALNGLTVDAPVYVRGYKVGQVSDITYNFSKDTAFVVAINVDRAIVLTKGTRMCLVADGLLGGAAIELRIPANVATTETYTRGDFIPTQTVPGIMDLLSGDLMTDLQGTLAQARDLLARFNKQLDGGDLEATLSHIEEVTADLTYTSAKLKTLMASEVPSIVHEVDSTFASLQVIAADLRAADLQNTIARADTAIDQVATLLAELRAPDGTIGKLINDDSLYLAVTSTVQSAHLAVASADSLLVDIKAHPKRYVHFSVFGKKDK